MRDGIDHQRDTFAVKVYTYCSAKIMLLPSFLKLFNLIFPLLPTMMAKVFAITPIFMIFHNVFWA
jgi:hypothetical protein